MFAYRKTTKENSHSKLRKSNALKMKQITNLKNNIPKQQQQRMFAVKQTKGNVGRVKHNNMGLHFASSSELIYTPFQNDYYQPPHLSSQNIQKAIFRSQSPYWKVRASSNRKYDYDLLYHQSERRYQDLRPRNRWSTIKSKIKSFLDQDRASHQLLKSPSKLNCCERQKHPDDDLSEQSSLEGQYPAIS